METIKNVFKYVLGGLIVIGFFTLCIFLLKMEVPLGNKDLFNLLVGALIGSFATVVSYFYGSSLGSSEKTKMLMKKEDNG